MPELPEVETFRRVLSQGGLDFPALLGKSIQSAQVLWPRTLAEPDVAGFVDRVSGQSVMAINRRGKYLIFNLSTDTLLIHLRMSGDLRVELSSIPLQPHDRLLIEFKDRWRLVFNDTRKFGRAWLVADPALILRELGPEPLDPALASNDLFERLHARRRQLKPLLLDQSFLAGLGNIYTDEALHMARLHPLTFSDRVTLAQAELLLISIRQVLGEGIRRNGSSIDWVYRGGEFQNYFRAYGRTGKPCPVCGRPIERLVIGQRGSHICPYCQPEPLINE